MRYAVLQVVDPPITVQQTLAFPQNLALLTVMSFIHDHLEFLVRFTRIYALHRLHLKQTDMFKLVALHLLLWITALNLNVAPQHPALLHYPPSTLPRVRE